MNVFRFFPNVLRCFAVSLCLAAAARGETPLPADAFPLLRFTAPLTNVTGDWQGKARAEGGLAVLDGCGPGGSAESAVTLDAFAHGDDSLALLVEVGPKNTAKALRVRITDQDQHECEWRFVLPQAGSAPVLVKAEKGASLLVPNQPDPRDISINDLRRLSGIALVGDGQPGAVLDVKVSAVVAVKPDAEALAAREALSKGIKEREGWLKNRNKLAAQYVAQFPEFASATPAPVPGKKTLRGYHIGNSLTFKALSYPWGEYKKPWSITAYEQRLLAFMDARGVRYVPGWHVSWGASLPSIWSRRYEPAVGNVGSAAQALAAYTWDILTLQLWGADEEGDVAASKNFIAMAAAKNPAIRVFLVETWVEKKDTLDPDYPTQWAREWKPGQKYGIPPIHCAAYAKAVFERLKKEEAGLKNPVRIIPIGTVLFELDKRMRAGEVPGYTRVEEIYNDKVHLKEEGNYVALETFYAVMTGQNPKGQPRTDLFPTVTDAFAAIVQETVWKVVTSVPDTGVSK